MNLDLYTGIEARNVLDAWFVNIFHDGYSALLFYRSQDCSLYGPFHGPWKTLRHAHHASEELEYDATASLKKTTVHAPKPIAIPSNAGFLTRF